MLIFFIIILLTFVKTDTYYFDSISGSDSSDGHSSLTSYKTLSRLHIQNGNTYLFKRGCVFKANYQVRIEDAWNITFDSYGDVELDMPVFDGGVYIGSEEWVYVKDMVYRVGLGDNVEKVMQVVVNEKAYKATHFPKNGSFFEVSKTSEEEEFVYAEITEYLNENGYSELSIEDFVGGRILSRPHPWILFSTDVISYGSISSQEILNLTQSFSYLKNSGFVVMNKFWMMMEGDSTGEWFFNSSTKQLYVHFEKDVDINSVSVRFPLQVNSTGHDQMNDDVLYLFYLHNSHQIVVQNIDFRNLENVIFSRISDNVTIYNCSFSKISGSAINVINSRADKDYTNRINNNILQDIGLSGIFCKHCCEVRENRVSNVLTGGFDVLLNDGGRTSYYSIGIYSLGTGISVISYSEPNIANCSILYGNVVNHTGYGNLQTSGNSSIVTRNQLYNSCEVLSDGCGLNVNGFHHLLQENIIMYGHSSQFLKKSVVSVQGLRPDDYSGYNYIINNLIYNFQYGILLHNSQGNIVRDNIVYGISVHSMFFNEDRECFHNEQSCCVGSDDISFMCYNIVENNIFHSISKENSVIKVRGYDGSDVGVIDKNYYFKLTNNHVKFSEIQIMDGNIMEEFFSLGDWNEKTNFDTNSKSFSEYYTNEEFYIIGNVNESIVKNGNFDRNISGWHNLDGYSELESFWNDEKQCLESINSKIQKANTNHITYYLDRFPIVKGDKYLIEFSASASEMDKITILVKKHSGDSQSVGFGEHINVFPGEMKHYSYAFETTLDYYDCTYHLRKFTTGLKYNITMHYFIDDLSLNPISDFVYNDYENSFTVLYNEDLHQDKVIELNTKYCDVDMNVIQKDTIVLKPFQSIFLLNCFCNKDYHCNNFENANSCPSDCSPICGNKVCESGENYNNCPSDCSRDDSRDDLTIIIIILTSVIILLCLFVIITITVVLLIIYFKKERVNRNSTITMELNQFK